MCSNKIVTVLVALFLAENRISGFNDLGTGNEAHTHQSSAKIGLHLYSTEADQPSCVGHGIILDTKTERKLSHHSFESKWAKLAVNQHNRERIKLGYSPVQLSQNLSGISLSYAQLMGSPRVNGRNDLNLTSELSSSVETMIPFDIHYEDTYYNEALRFQAPDVDSNSFRACCPAPFMRFISNETREIGLSRVVHNVMGNFKRLTFVSVFKPKSNKWEATGLCDSDPEILGDAMHDTSEYVDDDYEGEEDDGDMQDLNKAVQQLEQMNINDNYFHI